MPDTRPVRQIELSYALSRQSTGGAIHHPLLDLLQAVRDEGSISGAARRLGQSYRHAWGELKRWEAELGRGLVVWERGQAARLSPFGEKLLWAERQAQARLAPQIEALQAGLEQVFAVAGSDVMHRAPRQSAGCHQTDRGGGGHHRTSRIAHRTTHHHPPSHHSGLTMYI